MVVGNCAEEMKSRVGEGVGSALSVGVILGVLFNPI